MSESTTEQQLLAAIVAAPDDDGPRLVYADWLVEQGGDRAKRGELIQVQCRLAQMTWFDPAGTALRNVEYQLLWDRGKVWRAESEALDPTDLALDVELERGFVERLVCRHGFMRAFERLPVVCARVPLLRALTLNTGGTTWGLDRLAQLPELARLRSLRIEGTLMREGRLGAKGLATLLGSPHLRNLHDLALWTNAIGDEGAALLAASPNMAQLRFLSLMTNDLGAGGVKALAASPHLANLERLLLGENRIGVTGAKALAASPHLAKLRHLGLDKVKLDAKSTALLRDRFGDALQM